MWDGSSTSKFYTCGIMSCGDSLEDKDGSGDDDDDDDDGDDNGKDDDDDDDDDNDNAMIVECMI